MKKSFLILITFITANLFLGCSARFIEKDSNGNLDPNPTLEAPSIVKGPDVLASKQWNIFKTQSNQVEMQTGKRVKVALLGTGVDYTHEDLVGQIFINRIEWQDTVTGRQDSKNNLDDDGNGYIDDFIGYDFVEDDGFPFDRNGAGTAMAGIIGATQNNSKGIRGIGSGLNIMPVRFIDASGFFLFPNLIKALKYALVNNSDLIVLHMPNYTMGRNKGSDVLKLEKDALNGLLKEIHKKGIPIVASSGNSATDAVKKNSLIAEFTSFSNFIAVTSSNSKDQKPFIANSGMSYVKTSAPGKDILTTLPGNEYGEVSSTSIAAAHVGAALASAISLRYGQVSNQKLLDAFLNPLASDSVEAFKFKTTGGNRLNLKKYISHIKSL